MADVSVALLGLGKTGVSIGLALKQYSRQSDAKHQFRITGYSTNPAHDKLAQERGAVDEIAPHADAAVQGRDIVVMAMPFAEVEVTYQLIGPALRSGAVVIDLSPLKGPSTRWAEQYLPQGVHMLGAALLVKGAQLFEGVDQPEHANADLFDGGAMLLMPNVKCIKEAVDLGSDFGIILGARAQFVDPAEYDALTASTHRLPLLLSSVYGSMLMRSQGWPDAQRVTNPAFGMMTYPYFDTHPDDLRDLLLAERDDLLRHTDAYINTLTAVREAIAEGDREAIESLLNAAAVEYEGWYNRRVKLAWVQDDKTRQPDPGNQFMSSFLGGFLANRLGGRKDDDK